MVLAIGGNPIAEAEDRTHRRGRLAVHDKRLFQCGSKQDAAAGLCVDAVEHSHDQRGSGRYRRELSPIGRTG